MIFKIDEIKSAVISICAAATGTTNELITPIISDPNLDKANTAFQHAAWTVAIIAGVISIILNIKKLSGRNKSNNGETTD